MDLGYEMYCYADRDFYDAVEHCDDAQGRWAVTCRSTPRGWRRVEEGGWLFLWPPDAKLPAQGWKVHVSGCLQNAEHVLEIIWEYCVARRIAFKFLRSREILLLTNSKQADRASSGKLATIYPVGHAETEATVTGLAGALEGQPGPYILSDLRWGDGPVHVRYGGFLDQYCPSDTGDLVPAIAMPDGRLVPDLRRPVFQVPDWVKVPEFLAGQMAARASGSPQQFPYRIERALHFSNGGGVYLARETRTGRTLVLKEARPFAGIDAHGDDAVTRLERERVMLEQLSDVEQVPDLLDSFTCWEHEFLAEEYIEGDSLAKCVTARLPLVNPDPTADELAEYTAWAVDIHGRVEQALEELHHRGIVFGDLHPHNIMVRPDGRIVLVDFELAFGLEENPRHDMGAPGFVAPAGWSGCDIDGYALACVRLWTFVPPLALLLHRNRGKAAAFVRAFTEYFPVSETFAAQVLRGLGVGADGAGEPRCGAGPGPAVDRPRRDTRISGASDAGRGALATSPAALLEAEDPDWTSLRESMVAAILASATPGRRDRLFPGDVAQFRYGGVNLAYGAAGVLYALATTGAQACHEHVEWLVDATRRASNPHAGFYNGLHGVAYGLDHLGHHDEALSILDRALEMAAEIRARGLFAGWAGIALNLLHFARSTDEQSLHDEALRIADRLADAVHDSDAAPDLPSAAGLMYGFSGLALLFLRLYEDTADVAFLDLAGTALRRDLAYCQTTSHGTLQVLEHGRLMPYVAVGSAGIGLVACEYLRHRHDEELVLAQARLARACHGEFVLFAGLFTGRAGLMAYLSQISDPPQEARRSAALERHLRRLTWYAVPYEGEVAFHGDQLLRLSMDLATGSAGVLLALHAVLTEVAVPLPFLRPQSAHVD
jgi:predicted Ser/Thr protein kinase